MVALISAPTNLGLRPPQPSSVPGAAKAPEALREAGLFRGFAARGATDAGVVLPGRYVDERAPGALRNHTRIVEHARRLATRITGVKDAGDAPMVIGGDCSVSDCLWLPEQSRRSGRAWPQAVEALPVPDRTHRPSGQTIANRA